MKSGNELLEKVEAEFATGGCDALGEILDSVLAHFDCVTGTVHLLNADSGMLELKAQRGIPDAILDKVSLIPVGKGMAGLAAERREPVQVCNLQTDQSGDVRPGAKDTRMEGSVAAPMFNDSGEVVGTLGVAKPVAYDFTAEEMALLEEVGRTIARHL